MILFLYGADTFCSREYLRQSIDQFKKQRDPKGYNVVFLDGKKEPLSKLVAEMRSLPFLAEKRMVVIENILSSNDKELLAELIEIAKKQTVPDSTVVIFWQGEPLSKVKEAKELLAELSRQKFAREFSALNGVQLQDWIKKEYEKNGAAALPEALQFLTLHVSDMWQLATLARQLSAYKGSAPISAKDVQLFIDEKMDDNVFNLIEALVGGNKKLALRLLYEQRRLGEEEGKIFGLFIWQFRILLEMAEVLDSDPTLTSEALAKLLKIHPFVAKKNLAAAKRFSVKRLTAAYQKLLDIDIKTKTGLAPQDLLLDMFIQKT